MEQNKPICPTCLCKSSQEPDEWIAGTHCDCSCHLQNNFNYKYQKKRWTVIHWIVLGVLLVIFIAFFACVWLELVVCIDGCSIVISGVETVIIE
jgi:hypothetical protein